MQHYDITLGCVMPVEVIERLTTLLAHTHLGR